MANYEMYFCFPKSVYEANVPDKIKDKLKIVESTNEETGEITYKSSITWKDAIFSGKLGGPRWSKNGNYCIIKGNFSMLKGELTSLQELGDGKDYPEFSIMTKEEARELSLSNIFTEE